VQQRKLTVDFDTNKLGEKLVYILVLTSNSKAYIKGVESTYMYINHCLQEVAQSAGITHNKADVTSSDLPPLLVWTCQKKKKKHGT
jgi:hypothetical protein